MLTLNSIGVLHEHHLPINQLLFRSISNRTIYHQVIQMNQTNNSAFTSAEEDYFEYLTAWHKTPDDLAFEVRAEATYQAWVNNYDEQCIDIPF